MWRAPGREDRCLSRKGGGSEAGALRQVYGLGHGSAWKRGGLGVGVGMGLGALWAGRLPRKCLWHSGYVENWVCCVRVHPGVIAVCPLQS